MEISENTNFFHNNHENQHQQRTYLCWFCLDAYIKEKEKKSVVKKENMKKWTISATVFRSFLFENGTKKNQHVNANHPGTTRKERNLDIFRCPCGSFNQCAVTRIIKHIEAWHLDDPNNKALLHIHDGKKMINNSAE